MREDLPVGGVPAAGPVPASYLFKLTCRSFRSIQGGIMEQRFEGTPQATIRVEGRRLVRSEVTNDWGLRLQWEIRRNGQVVATVNARPDLAYEHADTAAGEYSVVLQMWRYVNYRKNPQGEFIDSRFIDISNRVTFTI
jgi:hypothetical protein